MRGVLTVAVLLACLHFCHACSCMPMHPQTQFCNSDFVILARVKRIHELGHERAYKVRVRKSYKLSEKAQVALKSGRLLTAADGAMCGVSLEPGKLYAISGRVNSLRANINLCGLATEWKDLTRRQRKGLRMIYKHGCSCYIDNCLYKSRCIKKPDTCVMTSKCHAKEGVCQRQKSKKCQWTKNPALANCLSPTISRWSG